MSTLSFRLSLALHEGSDPDLYLEALERDELLGGALLGLGNPGYLGVLLELPLSWDTFERAHQALQRLHQILPGATLLDAHLERAPADEDDVPAVAPRKLSDETIQAMVDSMRIPRS